MKNLDSLEISQNLIQTEPKQYGAAMRATSRVLRLVKRVQQPLHFLRSQGRIDLDRGATSHRDCDLFAQFSYVQLPFCNLQSVQNLLDDKPYVRVPGDGRHGLDDDVVTISLGFKPTGVQLWQHVRHQGSLRSRDGDSMWHEQSLDWDFTGPHRSQRL